MGYYMGDYYGLASRRAFGDPGFLSFLKGAGRVIGSALGLGGGGGATRVIERAVPGLAHVGETRAGAIIKRGVGIIKKHPVLTAAGAAGAVGVATGAGGEAIARRGGARGGEEGRRRRMNPFNPRALRRALRRTHSFAKMARKIVRVQHMYKKPRGRFAMGPYGRKKRKR
jgi:hypothetical protein